MAKRSYQTINHDFGVPLVMKIAFLGSRGIPRCYSGFETAVEEISIRLVKKGHRVTVYNRTPFNRFAGSQFEGVRIVRIPTIQWKGTDTLVHSALSTMHTLLSRYDIVYYCGVGSSIFSLPAKLRGAKTVVNVDGADWERAKWGQFGTKWLRWSESFAARFADTVIADHPIIRERYHKQFGIHCDQISYGAAVLTKDPGDDALLRFGLSRDGYFVFISRLTPENGADLVMEAHLSAGVNLPLVVIGDAPYLPSYRRRLKQLCDRSEGKIMMTGYQFADAYRQLSFHARAFVFPTTIEATRPVLLEQMGMGACVLARDTPANRHILANAAVWFDSTNPVQSLSDAMKAVAAPSFDYKAYADVVRERIRRNYNWDDVADEYERLFQRLTANIGRND